MGTKYTNENGGYEMAVAGRDKERETQLCNRIQNVQTTGGGDAFEPSATYQQMIEEIKNGT